jgi:ATP-binding cassette, subfamily C (CFTR/MRP), member 1
VFLALRTQDGSYRTQASLAADVFCSIAIGLALILSFVDYQRSLRPSTLLTLYLSASIVLGIVRTRTLWLIGSNSLVPALGTAILALIISAFLVTSVENKTNVKEETKAFTPEQRSGFWSRTCFIWLAGTLRTGYVKVISVHDLPALDTDLESHILRERLIVCWNKCWCTGSQTFRKDTHNVAR